MRFEWDESKRLANFRKHGVDFMDVPTVFDSPMLTRLDRRLDYGEDRWIAIGFLDPGAVVVVYTERDGEVIRIISARKANRHERAQLQKILDGLGETRGSFRR